MSTRALVTGSTGFIGGALTRRLVHDGWEVHSVLRPSSSPEAIGGLPTICRFHIHDGSTKQLTDIMHESSPDMVFHLAALVLAEHGPEDVESLIHSNVLFSTQLVEAMVRSNCKRLVNTGTSWQHYHGADYLPVNLYAATKQAFESILLYYHDAYDLSVITLKLFDTYGPGDTRRKLMDILVTAATSGDPLDISAGEQVLDLTHVEDVASAFVTAAQMIEAGPLPVRNSYFVSGERYNIRQLVELVRSALRPEFQVNMGGRPYRAREVMVPIAPPAHELLEWSPQFSLQSFLSSLAEASDRGGHPRQ